MSKSDHDDYYDDHPNSPPRKGGMSTMLILALVAGSICVLGVPIIAIVAAVAIPNLLEARKHGNEASAVGSLRTISASQAIYYEREGNGSYGTLEDLRAAKYVDTVLGTGRKQEYRFELGTYVDKSTGPAFWAKASPDVPGDTGDRYFLLKSSGAIYFSTEDFTVNKSTGEPDKKLMRIGGR